MKDKELRKLIGSRVKQRRLELNRHSLMSQRRWELPLLQSCVMRMVRLTIRKKNGAGKVLSEHSMYLWNGSKGKQMNMKPTLRIERELQIRDAMGDILEQLPLCPYQRRRCFSKDLLLLMLKQYGLFLDSFQFACKTSREMLVRRILPKQ